MHHHQLSEVQSGFFEEYYAKPLPKIALSKQERDRIWHAYKENREIHDSKELIRIAPALHGELSKSLLTGKNIQSAVFSECVYAQTLADHFDLPNFVKAEESSGQISHATQELMKRNKLVARYFYLSDDESKLLVQAGGFGSVDSALISVQTLGIVNIEFKEPYAKTSEPDLPKYGEDGLLKITDEFLGDYPQFTSMIEEQIAQRLNFFDHIGSNVGDFSPNSIQQAVLDNYTGTKHADAICTEDLEGHLVIMAPEEVHHWAELEGEIRPAGRNHYKVWTVNRLKHAIAELDGKLDGSTVSIRLENLTIGHERGGNRISRYKIDPLFFVRPEEVFVSGEFAIFDIDKVRQLNPTVAAKMNFKKMKGEDVRSYYRGSK